MMKKLILAAALLAPLSAQSAEWITQESGAMYVHIVQTPEIKLSLVCDSNKGHGDGHYWLTVETDNIAPASDVTLSDARNSMTLARDDKSIHYRDIGAKQWSQLMGIIGSAEGFTVSSGNDLYRIQTRKPFSPRCGQ